MVGFFALITDGNPIIFIGAVIGALDPGYELSRHDYLNPKYCPGLIIERTE